MNAVVETRAIENDSLPKGVVRLGWVSFLTDVSSEMIVSLLPAFLATVLGAPATVLGWIEGVAETTASALKVVSGRLSDRAKAKKPLVLVGYSLSSLVRPLIALATAWPVVVFIRFLDRVGKGIRSAPRDALIASIAPPHRRGAAFGLHRGFDNAGAVLGPLVAAGLTGLLFLPIRAVFALAAIPGLMAVAVLAFGVSEEAALPSPRAIGPAGAPADPPLPSSFWKMAAAITLFTLSASSDTFILLKAKELGVPAAGLPLLWSFSNAVKALFSRWGGGLSDRFGRRRLLVAAWSLYAACYAAFGLSTSALALAAVLGVYSFHYALAEGAERALVADLVPRESLGRAFGWLHGLIGLAALPASVGFGWVWEGFGSRMAFFTGAGLAAAAALALLLLVPEPTRGDRKS